jgi:hypothetical protein
MSGKLSTSDEGKKLTLKEEFCLKTDNYVRELVRAKCQEYKGISYEYRLQLSDFGISRYSVNSDAMIKRVKEVMEKEGLTVTFLHGNSGCNCRGSCSCGEITGFLVCWAP